MGSATGGKRDNQKLKPYIALQILQRETDENHVLSAKEIAAALELSTGTVLIDTFGKKDRGTVLLSWHSCGQINRPHRHMENYYSFHCPLDGMHFWRRVIKLTQYSYLIAEFQ